MKVALCGDIGVGKTSILVKLTENLYFPFTESTIGAGFYNVPLDESRSKTVEVWDTSGQERYRCLVSMYFRHATAVVVVYDVQSRQTFSDVENHWIRAATQYVDPSHVYLVGNKADNRNVAREVSHEEGKAFATQRGLCGFAELSARTSHSEDIREVFRCIYHHFEDEIKERGERPSLSVERRGAPPRRHCC